LIVNGPEDPKVDHDLVLMIDDWQLDGVGQIREQTFGSLHDWAHAGRIGNWVTVNGMPSPSYRLKDNSRVRLRLINAANARVFDLNFTNVKPRTIALDGYPVDPFESPDLTIGPSQRVDVILDLSDKLPEFALQIITRTTPITIARFLLDKSLGQGGGALNEELITPIRPQPPDASSTSLKIPVHMQGGAMGNLKSANLNGIMTPLRDLAQKHRKVWAFNGSVGGYDHMLGTARRGQFVILDIQNDTRWPHAMHLHGHHFWINSRLNPVKDPLSKRDTYLMQPGENAEFRFVADNPGLWLFHCHMLEHHAAGMGAVIEVT
jgi:FtsP/CotA-like multicopper oxidase with cupredoxin domain